MQPDNERKNKESFFELPVLNAKYTVKRISKAITIAFFLLITLAIAAIIVISTVRTNITIDAKGILEPARVLQLHSTETGRVANVLVYSGKPIKKGEVLIVIDSLKLSSVLKQYKSDLATMQINLEKKIKLLPFEKYQNNLQLEKMEASLLRARSNFRGRMVDFFPNRNIDSLILNYKKGTHVTLDNALADLIMAEAELKSRKSMNDMYELVSLDIKSMEIGIVKLKENINELVEQIKRLKIKAPIDGIVLTEGLEQLEGSYITEGMRLLEIAPMKTWNATLFVDEKNIHKINTGNIVRIEINALKTSDNYEFFNGKIVDIAAEPSTNKDKFLGYAGLYRISVSFEEFEIKRIGEDKFKKGYSITGKIITQNDLIIKLLVNNLKEMF